MKRASDASPNVARLDSTDLDLLRQSRNRITHYGFIPQDNSQSADLLLYVGLPYLVTCYREFFDLDLVDSLIPELAEYLQLTVAMYSDTRGAAGAQLDQPTHWFAAVGHWVRICLKMSYSPDWEDEALERAGTHGTRWELVRRGVDIELREGSRWAFDCPLCFEFETFVCDIDEAVLDVEGIRGSRALRVLRFLLRQ